MAELNVNGGPVFVDVATDQNYPMLFSRLTNSQNSEQLASVKNEEAQTEPQENDENKNDSNEESNTNSCIKIEVRRIRCPECKRYTAETEEKMIRHIRHVHRGENPFQCYMCDYSTYNKAVFEEHVRIHQGIKPFKCSQCDYRSASKKNTKKHEQIHRPDNPLRCEICNFIARHPKSLDCHKLNEHSSVSETYDGELTCATCNRRFHQSDGLRKHKQRKKICQFCGYKTCSTREYTVHLNLKHGAGNKKKTLVKLFHCALCKWSSNSRPRILLHLIHHPNQTVKTNIDISILTKFGIME